MLFLETRIIAINILRHTALAFWELLITAPFCICAALACFPSKDCCHAEMGVSCPVCLPKISQPSLLSRGKFGIPCWLLSPFVYLCVYTDYRLSGRKTLYAGTREFNVTSSIGMNDSKLTECQYISWLMTKLGVLPNVPSDMWSWIDVGPNEHWYKEILHIVLIDMTWLLSTCKAAVMVILHVCVMTAPRYLIVKTYWSLSVQILGLSFDFLASSSRSQWFKHHCGSERPPLDSPEHSLFSICHSLISVIFFTLLHAKCSHTDHNWQGVFQ